VAGTNVVLALDRLELAVMTVPLTPGCWPERSTAARA
jgi:hypothetical protein